MVVTPVEIVVCCIVVWVNNKPTDADPGKALPIHRATLPSTLLVSGPYDGGPREQ